MAASQRSLPIVGVMGSGSSADEERCRELGRWLAREGVHLLTGGGAGAMAAVSEGFAGVRNRLGMVIGILPAKSAHDTSTPAGYPNRSVELPIRTHLHLSGRDGTQLASRNHINVLTSDVVIAVAGAWGTRSEVALAVQYGKPAIAYLHNRSEIPQLPESVPVVSELRGVAAFVRDALGRAP